jgi:hypothetical protein
MTIFGDPARSICVHRDTPGAVELGWADARRADRNRRPQWTDLGPHATQDSEPPAGTVEIVPAARIPLIRYEPGLTSFERLSADIARYSVTERPRCRGEAGFGYLTGLDPALCPPRRATPRTYVRFTERHP